MSDYRDVPLVLRHSAGIRAGHVAAAVLASLLFLVLLGAAGAVGPGLTAAVAGYLVVAAVGAARERVELRRGELLVVNAWRTHRLTPDDVVGFSFRDRPMPNVAAATWAHLRDGRRVRLVALGWLPCQLPVLERWHLERNSWRPTW